MLVLAGCTAAPATPKVSAAHTPPVSPSPTAAASCAEVVGISAGHAATASTGTTALPTYWHPSTAPRPTGSGLVPFERLAAHSTVGHTANAAPAGSIVTFGPGTFTFHDFTGSSSAKNGAAIDPAIHGLQGSGVSATTFQMAPHSSTRAASVPTTYPATNQLSLLKVTAAHARLSGFTLRGSDQGHLYNGLRLDRAVSPCVSDVRVQAIPGHNSRPPGETFGINDYRSTHATYARVEVDGAGIGSVGLGANGSSDITVEDSYFHDNTGSMGASFWTVHNATVTDVIATDNRRAGLNFERVSGTVVITRPVLLGNKEADMRIDSDQGTATYTIVDPVYSGPYFTVEYPKSYYGHANTQSKATVHLIVHGKDRTKDLLRFTCPTGSLCEGIRTTVSGAAG